MTGTRRAILAGLASTIAAIAGCTTDPNSSEQQDETFEDVHVDGTSLVVELSADASVEQVNVIAPDGSTFATETVAEGATRVEFDLGTDYDPGEHRIVAVQDGDSVAEETMAIAPDVRIVEVGIGANNQDRMPESLNFPSSQALVSLENQGTGTEVIEELWILGDVPNPTTEIKNEPDSPSGIFDAEEGFGDINDVEVKPGDNITIFSTTHPFLYTGENTDCGSQVGDCQFILPVRFEESPLSQEYQIEYSAKEDGDECEIVLSGAQD